MSKVRSAWRMTSLKQGRVTLLSFICFMFVACRPGVKSTPKPTFEDAELKFSQGDLESASHDADVALQDLHDKQSKEAWRLRFLKSEILIWQGFFRDAVNLLTPMPNSVSSRSDLAAFRSVLLGSAYSNLQMFDDAEREFATAKTLNTPEVREVTCRLLLGEGRLAALHHEPARSDQMFRQAAEIAHQQNKPILETSALGNLGMLNMQQHRYAEAADWFNESIFLAQSHNAEITATRTLGNLGWAYAKMGDLDRAFESFSQAEAISERHSMITDEQTWLMNVAEVQFLRRDLPEAEKSYSRSLELARSLNDRQEMIYGLHGLTKIALAKREFSLAERCNQEAAALADAIGSQNSKLYTKLNSANEAFANAQYIVANQLFQEVVSNAGDDISLEAEALDGLGQTEDKLQQPELADKHYRSAIAVLDKERKSLGREEFELSYPTNAKDAYNAYIRFLMNRGRSNDAFAVAELHRAKTLTEGLELQGGFGKQALSLADTQRAASRQHRVILAYWLGPEQSYLWVCRPDGSQVFVLPGEDQIGAMVERHHTRLAGSFKSQNADYTEGQELYKMLIGPAERWITPEARITIIPDGVLCGLNFETLIVASPKPHYWIEDVFVSNANSTVLLSAGGRPISRRSATPNKTLLLIGDPKAPQYYQPLAHAGDEIRLIEAHFSPEQETVISGPDATPTAYFKAKPETFSFIHFVAHGTASRVSPLDSAVVLSQDGNSFNLYARDIAKMKLNARLVTISACDSAGSRIYSSEGLVGLSWAFLRAGAHQVLAALWDVDDTSTPRLMNNFYSGIADGEEPGVALRTAKLELLRSQTIYANPYYWGPFVLYEGAVSGEH
jgi:CHAT domain-containing protein